LQIARLFFGLNFDRINVNFNKKNALISGYTFLVKYHYLCKMKETIHNEKTFNSKNFSEKKITGKEFDKCTFTNCDFSSSTITQSDFIDCLFDNCNFSMANLNHSGLKNCDFINSKMIGVDFSICNDFLFSVNFKNCQLDYSTFFQKKMKKTNLKNKS